MSQPEFQVSLACDEADLRAVHRLRYRVFVEELGGDGPMVDHDRGFERDAYDDRADHLILCDRTRPPDDRVVGTYRLLRGEIAATAGGFYSEREYDLSPLLATGRPLLELGRSCLHPEYRGGTAMFALWSALARYVDDHAIQILFGVASFPGTNVGDLSGSLAFLHHRYLAPPDLRVIARPPNAVAMDLRAPDAFDPTAAIRAVPALIRAYLRLGGHVGHGAWVDHAFRMIDVCLILDTERMREKQAAFYKSGRL